MPGVGDYTSTAIMAIAFNQKFIPLDGNVERILKRVLYLRNGKDISKENMQISKNFFGLSERASDYAQAITGFSSLVIEDPSNELADNSQYWLAECYYSTKNYKRAILEFEKVFTFPGTDKDDDSQLKLALSYQSLGNLVKARDEYQRMVDYFPSSEYFSRAKESLKQLSLE